MKTPFNTNLANKAVKVSEGYIIAISKSKQVLDLWQLAKMVKGEGLVSNCCY